MILDEVAAVFEQEGDDAAEESERLPSLRMVRGSGSRQSHASAADFAVAPAEERTSGQRQSPPQRPRRQRLRTPGAGGVCRLFTIEGVVRVWSGAAGRCGVRVEVFR